MASPHRLHGTTRTYPDTSDNDAVREAHHILRTVNVVTLLNQIQFGPMEKLEKRR